MVYGCFASHGFIGSSSFRLIDDQRKKVMVEYGVELRNLKFLFFFFLFCSLAWKLGGNSLAHVPFRSMR